MLRIRTIRKKSLLLLLALSMAFSSGFCSCNRKEADAPATEQNATSEDAAGKDDKGESESSFYNESYAPVYFEKGGVSYEANSLCDGLTLYKNSLTITSDGRNVTVYSLEIDLTKVNIAAGTKDNSLDFTGKAVPSEQAAAYETATGKTVLAAINADFFGGDPVKPVNAFVKDGVIVKNSHNDNGSYDYTDASSDVPASAPMLFGVKGTAAQIAPMIRVSGDPVSAAVKQSIVQSKLGYKAKFGGNTYNVAQDAAPDKDTLVFSTISSQSLAKGGVAVRLDVSEGVAAAKVVKVEQVTSSTGKTFRPSAGKTAYLLADKNSAVLPDVQALKEGDAVSFTVTSPDGRWDGYETILGCRQSLVESGAIAATATKENTNGAQSKDVPRSAIGIKKSGKVVVFAVESMYYGKKNADGDSHGLSLPELADFMCYYGIKEGANFDGGGSTQLSVKTSASNALSVAVRSSDTGSRELAESRPVFNTLLVTGR